MKLQVVFSSRPQVFDQVVQFILGQVVGPAMLVLRVEDGPYLLERRGGTVMQVRSGNCDIDQLWRVEEARIVGWLSRPHVEAFLIGPFRSAVAISAAICFGYGVAELALERRH